MNTLLHKALLGLMIVTLSSCLGKLDVSFKQLLSANQVPPIMSAANITVAEEAGTGTFTVMLDKAYPVPVTLDYITSSNKAVASEDYTGSLPMGTLTFAPGELSKTISVTLINDRIPENPEEINLLLLNPSEGPNTATSAKMTIADTDTNFFGADVPGLNTTVGVTYAPTYSFTTTNTVTVDAAGGGDFTSIQSAINAAIPGTQILVNSGFYPEALSLNSIGNASGNPIVIKAAAGQYPVLAGADLISGGSLVNDNTDGEESAAHAFGFEDGTANGFMNYIETDNAINIVTGEPGTPMGTKAIQLTFGGTHSQNMIWNTFPYMDNLAGGEYRARFAFKLNAGFGLDGGSPSTSRGITLMRVEKETDTSSRMNIELLPKSGSTTNFYLKMYKNNTSASSPVQISVNTWVTVEFYYKKASAAAANDGIVSMTVNGTTYSNTHAIVADHNRFRLGSIVSIYDASGPTLNCPTSTQSGNACVSNGSAITFDAIRIEEGNYVPKYNDALVRTVYENGFESGLSDFTSAVAGSNTVAVSTTTPWDGSQTAKMSFSGTSATNSLRHTITDVSNDLYARVNFRLNSNFNFPEEAHKVESPGNTGELTREFDLLSLYGASGASGRLKVSLLKQGTRFFILGKILNVKDTSGATLSWSTELDIENYLQIYKGHLGDVETGVWNTLEIRYAGNKTIKSGVEIWLNGVSIASNINRSTGKYEGLLTDALLVDTVQLGTLADNNSGGSPVVSMQTTPPTSGSTIEFDGLKVTSGAPAGYAATGVTPIVYRYPYATPGAGEDIPKNLTVDDKVLRSVSSLSLLAPGTFYINTYKKLVYFRFPLDATYSSQSILSGRRSSLINVTNSSNIIFQGLQIRSVNSESVGCLQMVNSSKVKIIGNLFKGCSGPAINVADTWNAVTRSSDLLISGNTLIENGVPGNGSIFLSQMGNARIENNVISSSRANGVLISCAYDDSGSYNLTTNYCSNYTITRNAITESVNNAVYLNGNVSGARIYSNKLSHSRESGYLTQTTNGAWVNSGGSGIQVARGSHHNAIYNNLFYDIDKSGVLLHSAAESNSVFNNTIAFTGANVFTGGSSVDFHLDSSELNPDHRDPTQNNRSYNNIYSLNNGTVPCVNLQGDGASADQTNMSNNNIFYSCAVAGKYNSSAYTTLASFAGASSRETQSQEFSGVLYDLGTFDFTLDAGATFTATPYDVRSFMP